MVWTDAKAAFVDASASAIKAKTDPLPADPASESGAIKTETAAIKAKTDPLPADPASETGAIKGDTASIKTATDLNLDAKVSERATPAQILVDPATDLIDGSQIDASVISRAPASEYDTQMGRIDVDLSTRSSPADILVNPANKLDGLNLDAAVSDTATPGDILLDPGTDLIDGSLLDASVVSRSSHAPTDILKDGAKKVDGERVDQLLAGVAPIEGTCSPSVLDTPEVVVQQELGVLFYLEGHIDLSVMEAGDAITLSESISIVTPVDYKKYADSDYSGVQGLPLLYVETKPGRYGIKVELTQTLGTLRTFPYQFFVRRVV